MYKSGFFNCSQLQKMKPVEEQFKRIGIKQDIEESQEIAPEKEQVKHEDSEEAESSSDDTEESGDYAIMFPDENVPGTFEPKFLDKEGFTILSLTANKLEKKRPKKKKQKKCQAKHSAERSRPLGVSRPTVVHQETEQAAQRPEVIVEIPMKLDLSRLPPPTPIKEVNQNFKKWLSTLASKFGPLQPSE